MFIPFENLPSESRIWIYQADQVITPEKNALINDYLQHYCENWAAHGNPLKASFSLKNKFFVVLSVDENFNSTSGCSIDDSVRAIKGIEAQTGLNFFNRQLIPFSINGEGVLYDMSSLKEKFSKGMLSGDTLTFNNLITAKCQLESEWLIPVASSWLKRFIPVVTVNT